MESGKTMFPVIDMQKFRDSEMESNYKKLREACEEVGVCRIVNHGISPTLMSEMKEISRSLFDRPIEVKRRNVDVVPSSGYIGPSQNKPFYEALGFHGLDSLKAQINFYDQLDADPRERDIILKYSKAVSELIIETRMKLAKSLGVSGGDYFKGWPCQVKINKYDLTDQHLGLRTHTDSSFFTLLQDDEEIEGLEMIQKQTGEFQPVHPWPGTFLLVIGDLGKAWSNGRFHSPIHRVKGKRAAIRVSIVTLFFNPDDVAIEAPSELVDEEHPRLYLPLSYEGFRLLRLSKNMILGEALDLVRMLNTSV